MFKLKPWWTLGRNVGDQRCKSSSTGFGSFTYCLLFTFDFFLDSKRRCRRFWNYLIRGQAVAVWLSRPITVSNVFIDAFFFDNHDVRSNDQIWNLLDSKAIVRSLVFMSYPRLVNFSGIVPSSSSFSKDGQSSLWIVSWLARGQHKMCIAKSIDATPLFLLLLRLGTITILPSMKSLTLPMSSWG